MQIFDAHAHLSNVTTTPHLQTANNSDLPLPDYIVCNSTQPQDWSQTIDTCRLDKRLLPALGIHPWYTNNDYMLYLDKLSLYMSDLHAIGETGLDKLRGNFTLQKASFIEHIRLADHLGLTLVVHCVKAFDELYAIISKEKPKTSILIHGYNKSKQLAQQLCTICDCYFSLSPLFFETNNGISEKKRQLLDYLILSNRLLLETDFHFYYYKKEGIEEYQNLIQDSLNKITLVLKKDKATLSKNIFALSCKLFKAD
ncbi:MAG TPA: TatD family hydrolase [Spirochaetota bacterium]|nr:TatD family hydrolase [Spirochaetota bacterium]